MWLCRILKAFKQIYRNTAADSQRAQTCWLHTPWSEKLDSSSNLKIKAFCCTAWRKWNLKVSFLSGCSPKQTASGDAGAAGHHKHYRRLGPRDEERARGNNKAWQSESLQRGAAEKCPSTDNSRKTQFAPVFGVIVLKRKTTSWISTVSSRKRGIGRTNVDRKWSGRWVTDERSHCCDVTQTWHQRQNSEPRSGQTSFTRRSTTRGFICSGPMEVHRRPPPDLWWCTETCAVCLPCLRHS